MGSDPSRGSESIAVAVARVARRVRLQRALDGAFLLSVAGAAIAGLAVCLRTAGHEAQAALCFAVAVSTPLLGAAIGALRPLPKLLAARVADHALGGRDLLASAWSFGQLPAAERSPFMRACIARAAEACVKLDPRAAFPLRRPAGLFETLALGAGVLALSALQLPVEVAVEQPARVRAHLLLDDDLAAFRDEFASTNFSAELDEETRERLREINALLEALGDGDVDRLDALRELRRLERELAARSGEDRAALEEALRELGRSFGREKMLESVAQSLEQPDAAAAAGQLKKLSETLADKALDEARRKRLESALRRAAADPDEDLAEQIRREREKLDRLLRRKQEQGQSGERDRRLLRKKQRELERLEREQERRQAQKRELEQLRRDLESAANSLGERSQQDAAEQLEQAAQQMQRLEQSRLSKQQREELRQRLAQLREQLSKQRQQQQAAQQQSGQGRDGKNKGQGQRLSLARFSKLASGKGEGKDGEEGKQPGEQGKLLMPGEGKPGDQMLLLDEQGQQQLMLSTEEVLPGGRQAGAGGKPESLPEPTEMDARHVDTRITGEKGQGPSRSEVIRDASSRGFASRGYERVHAEYERFAESVLERDEVPGGYRFYVRRYFQLIRPRQETR